jgi:molybdopterin synthase sulfur carrier subunit
MMLKILYFASLRETLGCGAENLDLQGRVSNIDELLNVLTARGGEWATLRTAKNLRYAINQEMARLDSPLKDGDEVAFFPPVTGG